VRRLLDRAASAALVAGIMLIAGLACAFGAGYRVLVVRSDSMRPTIAAGDLILTRREHPSAARAGDVVTFSDPSRSGELVTHRVVGRRPVGGSRIAFVTRGDANTGVERWSIARDGTLGIYVGRLPRAGYGVAWLATPASRLVFVSAASLLLAAVLLRGIWAT
jgi:signal peptidase